MLEPPAQRCKIQAILGVDHEHRRLRRHRVLDGLDLPRCRMLAQRLGLYRGVEALMADVEVKSGFAHPILDRHMLVGAVLFEKCFNRLLHFSFRRHDNVSK